MISALIAWGIGFGGVNYIPTHGLVASSLDPAASHRTYVVPDGGQGLTVPNTGRGFIVPDGGQSSTV